MATSRSLAALLLLMVAAVSMIASSSAYQYQEDSVGSTFFLEKDLYPGSKMTLHFTGVATSPKLPRARADSIPFSSAKIPEILSLFSIKPTSPAAAAVRSTLAECEAPRVPGVAAQRCATSVESMVDFAAANLRTRNIRAGTTKLSKAGPTRRQAYAVESVRPLHVAGRDMVACHCMPYPYAVFGCHTTTATVYTVVLAGAADGTRAEALAACHLDATPGIGIWAYQKLGVVRGQVAVCHFLPQDSMLWMRK